jgi:biopolymer transport protein ExbD
MINLRKKKDFTAEVFTSSMNDIMFFLMLFFIIISTLLNPSMIRVALPNSRNSQTLQKKEINLTMTKEKVYYVNNNQDLVNVLSLGNRLNSKMIIATAKSR